MMFFSDRVNKITLGGYMACNGCDGTGSNCLRTDCYNKESVIPLMEQRLSKCIGSVPNGGLGLNSNSLNGIHFGQAVLFLKNWLKICDKSAKAILIHWHYGAHLVVAPCIKAPQYILFNSTSEV